MAYTQSQAHSDATRLASGSAISKAYTSNNTAHTLLVACIAVGNSSGRAVPVANVTDTAGNKWRQVGETVATAGLRGVSIWSCDDAIAGANTVTATLLTSASVNNIQMTLLEYSAGNTTYERPDSLGFTQSTGTTLTATTVDTCAANDLLVSILASNKTPATIPSGWTADLADTTTSNGCHVAHLLDSGTSAAKSAAWTGLTSTSSPVHIGLICAFKLTGVTSTAPRLLQSAIAQIAAGASGTAAFPNNTDSGSTLVAVAGYTVASGTPGITSVTDTQGLTWAGATCSDATNLMATDIWVASGTTAAADTLTFNFSPSTSIASGVLLMEYANLPSNMTAEAITGTTKNTVATTAQSVATTAATTLHDFVIATGIAGAYTNWTRKAAWNQSALNTFNGTAAEVLLDASNATQTATWTTSSTKSDLLIVGFTAGGGGANTPQALSVTTTTSPTVQKAAGKSLSLTASTAVTIAKAVTHSFAVTVILARTLAKSVGKQVTASAISSTAALTAARAYTRSLAASVASSVTMARSAGKGLSTSATTTAILPRNIGKGLLASATTTSRIAKAVTHALASSVSTTATFARGLTRSLSASVSTAASLIAGKGYFRTLAATVTLAPTLARNVGKGLTASATLTATAARALAKGLSVTVTAAPSLLKAIPKSLNSTVTPSAVLTAGRSVLRALSTSVSLSASLLATRTLQRALSASVAVSASLSRAVGKGLGATVATASSIGRAIGKGLSALVNLVPFLNAQPPGIGIDAFTVGPPFVGWEVDLQLSWAMNLTESWVVELEVPGWQPSPPESSWVTEVST